mmetsp:Transcript_13151/g.21893  ORF Transcript_13151/g.21893 Transcript_13151/m.21893 type:complete len:511 (+) Transcript_13151:178-1710(+)
METSKRNSHLFDMVENSINVKSFRNSTNTKKAIEGGDINAKLWIRIIAWFEQLSPQEKAEAVTISDQKWIQIFFRMYNDQCNSGCDGAFIFDMMHGLLSTKKSMVSSNGRLKKRSLPDYPTLTHNTQYRFVTWTKIRKNKNDKGNCSFSKSSSTSEKGNDGGSTLRYPSLEMYYDGNAKAKQLVSSIRLRPNQAGEEGKEEEEAKEEITHKQVLMAPGSSSSCAKERAMEQPSFASSSSLSTLNSSQQSDFSDLRLAEGKRISWYLSIEPKLLLEKGWLSETVHHAMSECCTREFYLQMERIPKDSNRSNVKRSEKKKMESGSNLPKLIPGATIEAETVLSSSLSSASLYSPLKPSQFKAAESEGQIRREHYQRRNDTNTKGGSFVSTGAPPPSVSLSSSVTTATMHSSSLTGSRNTTVVPTKEENEERVDLYNADTTVIPNAAAASLLRRGRVKCGAVGEISRMMMERGRLAAYSLGAFIAYSQCIMYSYVYDNDDILILPKYFSMSLI